MLTLTLEMLPAAEGDALLLTYGEQSSPHYVLIDGGRRSTYKSLRDRILQIEPNDCGKRFFELLIVSHIDADHIEGIICLLQDDELNCEFGDIWFNDYVHLEPLEANKTPAHLGGAQGEFLGALLKHLELPWNEAFKHEAVVMTEAPDPLPVRPLAGGMQLTVVSPSVATLIKLRKKWGEVITEAGFVPGNRDNAMQQFADKAWTKLPKNLGSASKRKAKDHSEANGSSIGVVAEYHGHRLLLSGDAWHNVLAPAMERWRAQHDAGAERVTLDAFKLPHHGSKNNLSPELMATISCPRYLVSSSGTRFRHPDLEAMTCIIEHHHGDEKPQLWFNYTSEHNAFWARKDTVDTFYEDDAVLSFTINP